MKTFYYSLMLIILSSCFNLFAQFNKVVEVSKPEDQNPVEVTIAINPQNPKTVAAAFISRVKTGFSDFTYSSSDGGETWTKTATANPEGRVQGDDGLGYGSNGRIYHSYLSFWGLFGSMMKKETAGIYVSSSSDGGLNWDRRAVVVDHINTSAPMEDKPYVVPDNAPDSPYRNNVYIAWTHFQKYGSHDPADSSQIYFSRSTDEGKTFSTPMRISTTGGDCIDSSNTVEGAITAVGPDGRVYVVWAGPKGMMFAESKDGGKTFGPEKTIGYIYHGWDMEVPGIDRANGMPVVKTDLSGGKYKGTIYVNWADDRFGDPDVFVKYSRDGGKSWSNPVRVNDDKINNGKYQFFTWMAVDPVDGSVNIVYYDRSNLDSTMTQVKLARSTDGGKTFVIYPIDQKPFNCNSKMFFGDYTGIDAYGGEVIPIWMYFKDEKSLAVAAGIFHFKPGTQEPLK